MHAMGHQGGTEHVRETTCYPLDTEDAKEEVVHVSLSTAEPLKSLRDFQLIFCYPEAVVENKRDLKIIKTTEFQRPIQAVVVDEAHFAID